MNKKKLMLFGLPILLVGLVAATLTYYVLFSTSFNINNINGMGEYSQDLGYFEFGDVISGAFIPLVNDLNSDRNLLITTEGIGVDFEDRIDVTYKSTLELTKKTVDFELDKWAILGEKVQIEYTIVGNEFSAEVVGEDVINTGYVLIYYADAEDRFVNPEEAILVESVLGNLPYAIDENAEGGMYDYSGEYVTSHGAKIWYVPSNAINGDGTLQWGRASEFYFESKLIQYNIGGEITFYSGDSLEITPEYTPDEYAVGEYTIITTIA